MTNLPGKKIFNFLFHIILFCRSKTPRAAYNLELLRVICQQISIIFNIPEGYLPKDASFDPFYISNWFQNLLRRCEDMPNDILFFFIDDLHKLNPLDCDIVAALSWLPISLPSNVFLICSTTSPIESLKLTTIQKERFKNPDNLYDLSQDSCRTMLRHVRNEETFEAYVTRLFHEIEDEFGKKGFARLATYLTCTEYGLSETELLELLMPIHNSDALIDSSEGGFNFSTFRAIRNRMSEYSAFSAPSIIPSLYTSMPIFSIHPTKSTRKKDLLSRHFPLPLSTFQHAHPEIREESQADL